ncbi:obscurin-like isoform X2 [Penaeus chinensis]|uniref:obscurin-like isoform X2 n=1 Tax=Penaeus chinensis TaxID=139456 RepID=UPI001FB60692|nr:obscurin-like isoform X2 [Penaeus chinensis]
MSHKYVSNKAVLQDKGFLSKLGSTLMGRSNPDPFVDVKVQSSISWHKTSDVKARIKTATGTIPVYDDLGEEEMAVLQAEALAAAGGSAPSFSGPAAVAVQTAALAAGFGQEETTQEATTVATYLVKEDYSPEDSEGLAAVSGQKLILVDKSSPNKRPRLEGDEAGTQLLDNSAARHKMAIRPKRNHPDPRSRAHDTGEERWLMRDQESGKEGLVPSRILELHSEFTTSMIASLKRSVQQIAMEETAEVKKNLMKEIREYKSRKSSSKLLGPSPEDEARAKRAATIRELIETEEEFVRDLEFVMENYYGLMDKSTTPRNVRDHKELIFNNFKFIADFHKNVLIEGVKYNVEVPKMIGKTFLRLERDFDKHAEYCSNEPLAQEFIENNIPVKEFFEEYSQKLGDDKRLQEHLKLPIQRLNDYQLLIRELVKYSTRLGDDPSDLQRAFELMQTIPQRATDAKFISSIEGFKGNLFKLGRLLRHDWFSVKEAGQKARDRYLFLFKARILITKVKRISEDRSIFILKDIIRLPETSLGSLDNPKAIEFFHIESLTHPNYPIFIEARTPEIREAWLAGIGEYVVDTASVEDLLFDDELRVVSQDVDEDDAGVVSPVPEVQEFEDLPEDGEAAEALPEQEDFWAREPSPPAKRQKPEAVPEGIAEVDFWAQKEPTPPRRKTVPELTPAEEAAPEQVEESTPVAEQEKASAEQASFIPQEPSPSAQQTPKDKPEPSKPSEAKPEAPKPAEVKPEPPKPTEAKVETPKPAEVKPEPPKPAEVKPEPPKPAEVKPEPPKPSEVKPEPPKQAEVKPEPPKPAEVKPEPPKPAEVKPEPPKPTAVPKQEPPKPEVQTRAPLAKLATPAPHKMQEPTTPFTPGGTPKPVFTKTLKGDVVEPGDGVTFVCEVAHPAPYFITWLKDSKPLDDKLADRVQQTDAGAKHALKMTDEGCKHTLQVLNCRVEDSGIYTAKATDENGVWSTCSAQLLVQELTEEERARRIAEKSPFFMVRMKPTQVIENTNLSYTIHVKGDPMPNVTFFKDDKELKEDARVTIHRDAAIGHYELLITHVQREDEGTYKCVATNKFGKAECEASMTVTDEEMLYESLSGKGSLLAQGEKAEFKWFRDGVEFDPHERFNVMFKDDEDTLALVFQNVTPEDAGLYTCVASTSCGKISCSAELTVEGSINRLQRDPEPPNFKEELTDTQVNVGGSAMLECKIGGYPKPELAWTRNGLDVKAGGRVKFLWEDEESVALIIKNCEEKDAGLYRVIAKNELGEVSCSAKLGIKAGPKIVSMKKEVACVVGQKLDYRVEVEGEPTPEIRWLKDGKQLMESDHIKFTKESDTVFAFKIDSMQMDDCCTYTVVASNPMGQVSEFFTIATDSAPQITRGLDPEIEKRFTYDIALEVRGTGSPKPMAKWYKNGKEIMADDRFKMVVDESFYILKIRRLERKDKGTYCCELSNSSGTAKTEGVLSVRAPPDFVTPLKDACAKEGGKDVKMFVEWEANPAPTVKWFFNDKPIRDDTPGYTLRGQDTSMVLTIHEATEDVVGTYTVKATNEYGESVCKARFRLHEAPVVTEGLKDAEFLEDSSAKFTFKATGVPTPEIKWTKDGKKWSPDMNRVKLKQEGDDTFTLYFDEAKTEDSGHYVATISNVEGTASTEATIVVNTPPHIKGSNFRDGKTFIAMHKFVLEVEATAVPEAEATWYFNDKKLSVEEDNVKFAFDGSKYTMERIGSDPEHSGQYKCVLKNKIKEVEEVGQVTVIEKEARVRRPLEDIYVKENTDATLKCQIVGDPIPSVEWLRNGKPLPPSERYEVSEERMKGWHTLVLKEVTEQDKSTFTVKGKNKHGECETTARLGVLVRPQPGELNDATVDYGKDLLLNVAIHAFPPPKMVWTLDGRELQEGDHYEYTRDEEKEVYGLLVHSAVLEDAGKITFTASNAAGSESGSCTVKVHTEKPAIVADLEDLSFCLEDDAVFTLRASGLPLPDVEWKLHDKVVKADERHVFTNPEPGVYCMTIKDVCMNDYGPVAVVAKSLVGECASAAKFSQKKIPCEVVEGLENVTKGAEGDDVTLTVKIRASPRPNFVWTKDSDNCEASEKIVIEMKKTSYCEATISLTLVEASSIDSGQYRLRFQNELNEESSETALIVRPERRKPKITKPPKELQVLEGKRGIFQAKVTGFPKPEVKWMKDGRQIYPTDIIDTGVTGDGFQYLEFKTVTMEDVGQYTIFASNEEGTAEFHTSLTVVPPPSKPEFLQSLKASKVILGYPVRMEVKLGGHPMPEVQWLKDGQPLNIDGTHYKQIVEPDGTVILQIDAATEGDMGEITCVAKNPEGDSQSSATLSVLGFKREDGQPDGPAAFTEGLKDMCFDEGMVMRLPVAMKGGPVPNMKWYKDGQEIKLDDRCFFTYDGDRTYLEIRPCKGSDSGMYKCVIQNSHGSAETECEVSIRKCYEPPFFTSTFTRMDKLPGSEVKMSVRYDGVPKPELSWFHNGEPILHDGDKYRIRKEGDGQTLTVKELTYSDSGNWKVVAKNREGETEHEAELNVSDDVDPNRRVEAPVFMKVIGDQELFEGYNALFKAVVSGKPEPEFKWLKNGGTIVASNRVIMERDPEGLIRLTIKRITPEDAGQYTLKVWNDYGEAICHGKLICETLTSRKKRPVGDEYKGFDRIRRSGVPMPLPEKPMISALADRRLTLSWMPHLAAAQTMPCTYQVEMCDAPDGDWFTVRTGIRGCSVDITNLMPKGDYKFRVRVANKYGVSEPSPYVATQRFKLELPAVRYEPQMDPNYEYKGDGPYVPRASGSAATLWATISLPQGSSACRTTRSMA